MFAEQSCCRCLCLLCPPVQLAHLLPPQSHSGLWCSPWHLCACCWCGFLVACVVCVAIAKWSQRAAPVCTHVSFCCLCGHCKVVTGCSSCLFMCQPDQPFFDLFAALKGPCLALLSRGCHKPCPRPFFQSACGPSCCGAVRGLTLRCSCWALAFSWSPFVPVSFFEWGLMDIPLSSLLHPFVSLRFVAAYAACSPCNHSSFQYNNTGRNEW